MAGKSLADISGGAFIGSSPMSEIKELFVTGLQRIPSIR
jgi:hypothetical protein